MSGPTKSVKPKEDIRSRIPKGEEVPTLVKIETKKSKVKIPKLASLKELLAEGEKEQPSTELLPKIQFTQDQLLEAWMEYAYSIKKSDLDFFSTLSSFLPSLKSATLAQVVVHNTTQSSDITKMKPELLSIVRTALQNFDFDFEIVVNKEEAKEIAVTPQEKYAKLVEKNPLLEELRNRLSLGF